MKARERKVEREKKELSDKNCNGSCQPLLKKDIKRVKESKKRASEREKDNKRKRKNEKRDPDSVLKVFTTQRSDKNYD